MAKNFIQEGEVLTIPAPYALTSGDVVIAGDIIGVALSDAASGASVDVHVDEGVWGIAKVAADAFALGDPVYYDSTAKLGTATATGNTKIGTAIAAAAAGSATVNTRIVCW